MNPENIAAVVIGLILLSLLLLYLVFRPKKGKYGLKARRRNVTIDEKQTACKVMHDISAGTECRSDMCSDTP